MECFRLIGLIYGISYIFPLLFTCVNAVPAGVALSLVFRGATRERLIFWNEITHVSLEDLENQKRTK